MKIINRRDNSPETQELVERRIELPRPGHMRHHWHKKLEREILLPRRPDDVDRKEIKRIDIRLRSKEENRVTHTGAATSKTLETKFHKHPVHHRKSTRKPQKHRSTHRTPNPRSLQHQKNR